MGFLINIKRVLGEHAGSFIGEFFKLGRLFNRSKLGVLIAAISLVLIASSKVYALGVGAAEADSYIGQRLSVRIPLFNVANPNSLSIEFTSPQFGREGQSSVQAVLDRSNSQLAIKLTSSSVINEPYLDFNLELNDGESAFNKDFTVLLNLAPRAQNTVSATDSNNTISTSNNFSVSDITSSKSNIANGDLMGPYEYAETGNIPARFGAVLDGQSLWRVARRINGAMGVSRSQMMWALYQANPDAFTSRSVQSLKAGSYLNIPNQSLVQQVSHEQAKANLSALSSGSEASIVAASSSDVVSGSKNNEDAVAEFLETTPNESGSDLAKAVPNNTFQVASVGELGGKLSSADPQRAQEILASLTESVGNLSQQLVRKDEQIESLQAQVAELKSFISEDANLSVVASSDNGPEALSAGSVSLANTNLDPEITGSIDSNIVSTTTIDPVSNLVEMKPIWLWAIVALGVLLVAGVVMRARIAELWQSLHLFGSNERVEFNDPTVLEMPKVYSRDQAAFDSKPEQAYAPNKTASQSSNDKNYSELVAVEKTEAENSLAGITLNELDDDDGSFEPNDVLEFVTEEAQEVDEEDLSFDERFNYLLDEKDFDFARELLDFARYNEINDDRYHFERLRLFEKMSDEDGFYQYYYEIEEKIPSFPMTVQTEISQLVVQLAHT